MRQIFLMTDKKLRIVTVRDLARKNAIGIGLLIVLISVISIMGFEIITNSIGNSKALSSVNEIGDSQKSKELAELLKNYNEKLTNLIKQNNDLRIAANLDPLTDEEFMMGTGGSSLISAENFFKGKNYSELGDASKILDEIERKIAFQQKLNSQITNALADRQKYIRAIPAIKPVSGTFPKHSFGIRNNPFSGRPHFHKGIDITAKTGTPVVAAADGVVMRSGYNAGFGIEVTIKHEYGYQTIYAHLSATKVAVGQQVRRGDVVGLVGSTGLSTGPHLHYEVLKDGENLNPADFFFDENNEAL